MLTDLVIWLFWLWEYSVFATREQWANRQTLPYPRYFSPLWSVWTQPKQPQCIHFCGFYRRIHIRPTESNLACCTVNYAANTAFTRATFSTLEKCSCGFSHLGLWRVQLPTEAPSTPNTIHKEVHLTNKDINIHVGQSRMLWQGKMPTVY